MIPGLLMSYVSAHMCYLVKNVSFTSWKLTSKVVIHHAHYVAVAVECVLIGVVLVFFAHIPLYLQSQIIRCCPVVVRSYVLTNTRICCCPCLGICFCLRYYCYQCQDVQDCRVLVPSGTCFRYQVGNCPVNCCPVTVHHVSVS